VLAQYQDLSEESSDIDSTPQQIRQLKTVQGKTTGNKTLI